MPVCWSLFPNPPTGQCQLLVWDKPPMPGWAAGWQAGHLLGSQRIVFIFVFLLCLLNPGAETQLRGLRERLVQPALPSHSR